MHDEASNRLSIISHYINNKLSRDEPYNDQMMKLKWKYAKAVIFKFFVDNGFKIVDSRNKLIDFTAQKDNVKFDIVVKTKNAMLEHYATGYELKFNSAYKKHAKNKHLFIIFVDDRMEKIYGQWFNKLQEKYVAKNESWEVYPHKQITDKGKTVIFYSIKTMKMLSNISKEDLKYLKRSSKPSILSYSKQIDKNKKECITENKLF